MENPSLTDYVSLIYTLFEEFAQANKQAMVREQRCSYSDKTLTVFFMVMQYRRIFQFKTQWRWLNSHPIERAIIGLAHVPDRATLSRRYKGLSELLQAFIGFTGQYADALDTDFESRDLYEDQSLFKAGGSVWHESDRQAGRIPDKLRHLDQDASWSKSGYHGWVDGYGLHLTCNGLGLPKLLQVETAAISEKQVMNAKTELIMTTRYPQTLTADNRYAQAKRIRDWAKAGVVLLTPAAKWTSGRYACAYHAFIRQPDGASLRRRRRTAIEPCFDLCAQTLGTLNNHIQLPLQHLSNVRTCLAITVFSLPIAMLANSIWRLPLRSISNIRSVFS